MFLRTVVDAIRTKPSEELNTSTPSVSELTSRTTLEDRRKISALDWLLIGDSVHYSEALRQGNALLRTFILARKMDAARETFAKLPTDIIDGELFSE